MRAMREAMEAERESMRRQVAELQEALASKTAVEQAAAAAAAAPTPVESVAESVGTASVVESEAGDAFDDSPPKPRSAPPQPEPPLRKGRNRRSIAGHGRSWGDILTFLSQPRRSATPLPEEQRGRAVVYSSRQLQQFEMTRTVAVLRSSQVFKLLSEEEARVLIDGMSLKDYAAGEVLMLEGEVGESLYVIVSGTVSIRARDASGEDVEFLTKGAGTAVGEGGLVAGDPRRATVAARTVCRVSSMCLLASVSMCLRLTSPAISPRPSSATA